VITYDQAAHEIRLFGDGSSVIFPGILVYHTDRRAWSRFSHGYYGVISAVVVDATYFDNGLRYRETLFTNGSAIFRYSMSNFEYHDTDGVGDAGQWANNVTMSLRWPFIDVGGQGGHQRLRKIRINLLPNANLANVAASIQIRYDGSETVRQTKTITLAANARFIEVRPSRQRCASVSVQLDMLMTWDQAPSPTVQGMSLEVGVYEGSLQPSASSKRAT
jgi:hypothetical protein